MTGFPDDDLRAALQGLVTIVDYLTFQPDWEPGKIYTAWHGDTDVTGAIYGPLQKAKEILRTHPQEATK